MNEAGFDFANTNAGAGDGVSEGDGDGVSEGVSDGDGDGDGVSDGIGDGVSVRDGVSVCDGDWVSDGDSDGDGVSDGDGDGAVAGVTSRGGVTAQPASGVPLSVQVFGLGFGFEPALGSTSAWLATEVPPEASSGVTLIVNDAVPPPPEIGPGTVQVTSCPTSTEPDVTAHDAFAAELNCTPAGSASITVAEPASNTPTSVTAALFVTTNE